MKSAIQIIVASIILFGFTIDGFSQTKTQFNGGYQIFSVNTGGTSEYVLVGAFLNIDDKYSAANLSIGDKVIDSKGDLYIVKVINSISGVVNIDVEDPRTVNIAPDLGKGIVFTATPNSGYPLWINAMPEALRPTVFNTFALLADDYNSVLSGDPNPGTGSVGDIFYNTTENILYVYNGTDWDPVDTDDQTAVEVEVTPAGNLTSINVQTALVELQGDINTINGASHAAVTIGTANGLSLAGQAISLATATTSTPGAMIATDKTKLDGIATGAEVNVNADWTAGSGDAQILNKPTTFTPSAHTLDGHSNVTVSGIATNDILQWNGTAWINNAISSTGMVTTESDPIVTAITGLVKSNGTTISAAVEGTDYLTPTGSAASLTNFPTLNQNTTGNAATATKLATPRNINGVAFDGTSNITITAAADAHTLDSHSNVAISGNTAGELLKWNGTSWINNTLVEAGITDDQTATEVAVTTTADITSNNVQAALEELQGDINTINGASHAAVTIGTANGLSLAGQAMSLAVATTSTPGAMLATDKTKLDGIATGAEVNVNADWNASSGDAQILNKPTISSILTYASGNAIFRATGTGVTYSLSGSTATVTIPVGVSLLYIRINETLVNIGSSTTMDINIVDNNTEWNTGDATMLLPIVQVYDRSTVAFGGPTVASPYPNKPTPVHNITSNTSNTIGIRILSTDSYSNFSIVIHF